MKRLLLAIYTVLITLSSTQAQTIVVKNETARIKAESATGVEVELQGTYEEAETAMNKWLKTFGKSKSIENYIAIAQPTIQGTAYATPIYAMVKQVGNVTSVWIGLQKKEWDPADADIVLKDLESLTRSFGVNFHREKIQKQIDESTRAVEAVERQQQRLANQSRDLNTRVEDNKREKIQLEKSLENNKVDLENLLKRIEKNKKDQDSIAIALEQVKKVVEMHRDKQRKVN